MLRFAIPGLLYLVALGFVAAGWSPSSIPLLGLFGQVLYPVATLYWVFTAMRDGPPRPLRATIALVPAVLPIAFSALALRDSDEAVLGIVANWPITLVAPLLCLWAAPMILFTHSESEPGRTADKVGG